MSANHSDCWYAIRGDRVPVTGTRYTTYFSPDSPIEVTRGRILTHNGSNYAQSRKEMPFGVRTMEDHIQRSNSPKTVKIGREYAQPSVSSACQ